MIYPSYLNLNTEQSGIPLHFLDVSVNLHIRSGHEKSYLHSYFYTKAHDKRDDPKYAKLQITKYPDPQSALSKRCLLNIITSQAHRFKAICLRRKDFIHSLAALAAELIRKGYIQRHLQQKVRAFFQKQTTPTFYHVKKASRLYYEFKLALTKLR